MVFYSGGYTSLELFPEMDLDEEVSITVEGNGKTQRVRARNRQRVIFPLEKYTTYTLSSGGALPALMYLNDCEGILDVGVQVLNGGIADETYHYTPCKTRTLGPCGLCFHRGYYHMFYPHNPFSGDADLMYWGHAVSRDLLHWKPLPIVFEPADEMRLARYRMGGAYAGSAAGDDTRQCLYFTRHIGERKTGKTIREYQVFVQSRDMLRFGEETPVFPDLPGTEKGNFHHPKVTTIAGVRYMVLGGSLSGCAAMLLYREMGNKWEHIGTLVKEKNAVCMENPDFFSVGRACAAIGGFCTEKGKTVGWYTGTFREGHFRIRKRGYIDFGGDFYAPQTFLQGERRLLFGRISDGESGCMTLPREVFVRGGRLGTRPAAEVYSLVGEKIYEGKGKAVSLVMEKAAFMVRLRLSEVTDFVLTLGRNGDEGLFLHVSEGTCFLETTGARPGRFYAEPIAVKSLEIFVDTHAAEVFINDGETVGTRYFCVDGGFFAANFARPECVDALEVCSVRLLHDGVEGENIPSDETFEF